MKNIINLVTPPITSYPSIAYILSIIGDQKHITLPWFSDHFIQLIIRPNYNDTFGDYYDHADIDNYFRTIFTIPGINWMRVNSDMEYFDEFTM